MPHSTAAIPTDPTGILASGAVLVEVSKSNARRVYASVNGVDAYTDQVDTDYEIRGYSYASCAAWVNAASATDYPSSTATRLEGGAGIASYRLTTATAP